MGVGFQQNPWTPTPRRGPIAAELKSPGPALVDLPPLLGKSIVISGHIVMWWITTKIN